MLVLSLYDGEKIHIGDDIEVVIDRCVDDGNCTRLGIVASDDLVVLREELVDEVPN